MLRIGVLDVRERQPKAAYALPHRFAGGGEPQHRIPGQPLRMTVIAQCRWSDWMPCVPDACYAEAHSADERLVRRGFSEGGSVIRHFSIARRNMFRYCARYAAS